MKKRVLSLALTLVLALSLAVPAFADETVTCPATGGNLYFGVASDGAWINDADPDITAVTFPASVSGIPVDPMSVRDFLYGYGPSLTSLTFPAAYCGENCYYKDTYGPEFQAELFVAVIEAARMWDSLTDVYWGDDGALLAAVLGFSSPSELQTQIRNEIGRNNFTIHLNSTGSAAQPQQPAAPQAPASGFTDVQKGAYYYEPVLWAVDKSITSGTSATTFSPDQTCTRAQIITFLWKAAGSPEPKSLSAFSDVKTDAYYAKAAAWAKENGIASGAAFSPDAPCTRQMAVEFMWKHAGSPSAPRAQFTDASSPAVDWAVDKSITSGTSDTTFSPDQTCTRAQIMTFLYKGLAG